MLLKKIFSRFQNATVASLVFDQSYCRIYYHKDIQTIHLDWKEFATTAEFTRACDFSLKLMVEKKANKMVADNSKVTEVSLENQFWLTENWFPRALENGFQYSAVITSDKTEVSSALQLIVSRLNTNHVIVKYFADLHSAKDWLSKV